MTSSRLLLRASSPRVGWVKARLRAVPTDTTSRAARWARFALPTLRFLRSQPEHVKHGRVAHLLELGRVDEPRFRSPARPRRDRHELLAVHFEAHRRRGDARADVEFPQLLERGVVIGGDGAVEERVEYESAAGRERAGIVRVAQVHALLDLAGHRVDGGKIAFVALLGLEGTAVPTLVLAVLRGVDRYVLAIGQRRYVDELGLGAIGGRPVVVAAGMTGAHSLGRLARILVGDAGIGLDVLRRIVVDGLAGLLVDALGPIDRHIGLRHHGAAVE